MLSSALLSNTCDFLYAKMAPLPANAHCWKAFSVCMYEAVWNPLETPVEPIDLRAGLLVFTKLVFSTRIAIFEPFLWHSNFGSLHTCLTTIVS